MPLSLSNLHNTYGTTTYEGVSSCLHIPFTPWAISSKKTTLEVHASNHNIEFSYYSSGQSDKKSTVTIAENILYHAFANPEQLSDGNLGVYAEERKTFNGALSNLPFALLAVNLAFGNGVGKQSVAMVFSPSGSLLKIKIGEQYKGKNTLFEARNLKNSRDIRNEYAAASAEKKAKQEQEERHTRFNFAT